MSGSAALEYGFPSTHSTNAVSVALYALLTLRSESSDLDSTLYLLVQLGLCLYTFSVVLGRIYCGMHGFLDVIAGSLLGGCLALIEFTYGDRIDGYLYSSSFRAPLLVFIVVCVLVRIHPEPVDDCPCFDDSVAFAGVVIGIEFGNWHYARSRTAWNSPGSPGPAMIPFDLDELGWTKAILRIVLGVSTIFAWRGLMKPTLLRCLPPLFRVFERLGLTLPRRFFIQASLVDPQVLSPPLNPAYPSLIYFMSLYVCVFVYVCRQYKNVPSRLNDNEPIPTVSKISSMVTSMRRPRRRAVSVGPQSEADAYEAFANRELEKATTLHKRARSADDDDHSRLPPGIHPNTSTMSRSTPVDTSSSSRDKTGSFFANGSPPETSEEVSSSLGSSGLVEKASRHPVDKLRETEFLSRPRKSRVRYDVEVITKLIVYAGMFFF